MPAQVDHEKWFRDMVERMVVALERSAMAAETQAACVKHQHDVMEKARAGYVDHHASSAMPPERSN